MPSIEGDLAKALRLLQKYFAERDIPFALIGALVPALRDEARVIADEARVIA